jgi:hypothetical protein
MGNLTSIISSIVKMKEDVDSRFDCIPDEIIVQILSNVPASGARFTNSWHKFSARHDFNRARLIG